MRGGGHEGEEGGREMSVPGFFYLSFKLKDWVGIGGIWGGEEEEKVLGKGGVDNEVKRGEIVGKMGFKVGK